MTKYLAIIDVAEPLPDEQLPAVGSAQGLENLLWDYLVSNDHPLPRAKIEVRPVKGMRLIQIEELDFQDMLSMARAVTSHKAKPDEAKRLADLVRDYFEIVEG